LMFLAPRPRAFGCTLWVKMIENDNQHFWEGRWGRASKRTEARALRLASGRSCVKQRLNLPNLTAQTVILNYIILYLI